MTSRGNPVLLVLAFGMLACILPYSTTFAVAHQADAAKGPSGRWEHSALTHESAEVGQNAQLSAQIVKMGDDGWELVCVTTVVKDGSTAKTIYYFKRPKS